MKLRHVHCVMRIKTVEEKEVEDTLRNWFEIWEKDARMGGQIPKIKAVQNWFCHDRELVKSLVEARKYRVFWLP